jgi:hypothetical protein
MEFEVNRTPSLDVEIDGKPLDLSLDSDVDGLASSIPDKDEDEDFDIIEDKNVSNDNDEIDNFSYESKSFVNNDIQEHMQMDTKEDLPTVSAEFKSNDDDGLGLEQDEILGDELIKSKLELKESTDSEKEKEVNTNDYEYSLKQDDGCQAYDPMTTSMIQTMDPMTSSMINFDTQTINHASHADGESESLQMSEVILMKNIEHNEVKNYSSSSEDEEDHTEKKDKEKDHSSSSSSDSDDDEEIKKVYDQKNIAEDKSSSSSSSSEDEENEQIDNDTEELIKNKQSTGTHENNDIAEKELSKELQKQNSDVDSSSSDEENEINDDDKDMGSEKDMIPYSKIKNDIEEQNCADEEEKDISDEKHPVAMEFSLNEIPEKDSDDTEIEKEEENTNCNEKYNVENPTTNNFEVCPAVAKANSAEDKIITSEVEIEDVVADKEISIQSLVTDQCFDKREDSGNYQSDIIQDNASSILGDVCSIPDMHSDEAKMNVEQDVFAADMSADNIHPEDEREDCPIPNAESRNGSRKNSLGSLSSVESNEHEDFEHKKLTINSDLIATKSEEEHQHEIPSHNESFQFNEEKTLELSQVKQENNEFEDELPNNKEDVDICSKPEIDNLEQFEDDRNMLPSNTDNSESDDVLMKESMVTNISEGRPADFGFELSETVDHETKDDSPTMQTQFFEKSEIAQDNSMGAFSDQTSSKIESNEYCYQENEDTSLDLASLNSQVPAGELSSVEIAENAAASTVDENLMVDNMSNIKETEFLVETNTNLASSQEPSEIFSQNDEHMAQKVSESGVNGEYEHFDDKDETSNCFEDNSTKDTSVVITKQVENEMPLSDNVLCDNEPKEIYENTEFELNSTEKQSVFDQKDSSECAVTSSPTDDPQIGSHIIDNESNDSKLDMDTQIEISNKTEIETQNVHIEVKDENNDLFDTNTPLPKTDNFEQVKINEMGSQPGDIENKCDESNLPEECADDLEKNTESETIPQSETNQEAVFSISNVTEEVNQEQLEEEPSNVDLIQKTDTDSVVEKSNIVEFNSHQQTAGTELPKENENVTEKISEIDLQTGIQDSEPAIEIETTKEPQVETHLTSQELNANTAQQLIENMKEVKTDTTETQPEHHDTAQHLIENVEEIKTDTTETQHETSIISLPVTLPIEETKNVEEVKTDTTEIQPETSIISVPVAVPIKETNKLEESPVAKADPAITKKTPKAALTSKPTGSATKPSKTAPPSSASRKSDTAKAPAKPSPRPTASTPKAAVSKAGPAGVQASAPRRSVPPAKPNTTAPKTTAGSALSANGSKPGTTTKPQTNGVSRPTSATTRPTARPASAKPTTTPSSTKTPTSRPQTAKPSSAPAKAPSSRPATAGTTKTPTTARTPLSTRTTPLTRPSPTPSTLRPRPTSTSRLRAASATRKAQVSASNGTSKAPLSAPKAATARTPLSRPSPKTPTSSTAGTKTQTKTTTSTTRPAPSKTTPSRPTPSKPTPGTKKTLPATKAPTKPGSKTPVQKGSSNPIAIKKPSAKKSEVSVEEDMEIQPEENKVNGLSNGVHTNGVNGVHSDEEGQSLKTNGCNGALDCTEPVQ